jgi:3,4-dihydroxy 2-butanone 4-phosphate synthase/GTP cyclohydrolase II
VFPLVAHPSGVLGRRGQTEGSFDLARISGFSESAVICEILNPDGTMTRGEELLTFAMKHDLQITSVEEVLRYRVNQEILIRNVGCVEKETDFGTWKTYVFEDDVDGKEHLALVYGTLTSVGNAGPLARIHSECLTGDVFESRRCDCGDQLRMSMKRIVEEGAGVILYLRQEGRGIGLANKLRAYALQDQGHDTVEANLRLGFAADARDFGVAAKILQQLGVNAVRLMTNNPEKLETLESFGIVISERVSVKTEHDPYCAFYIETKKKKMGHLL